jgi:hypothetical protein
VQTRTKWYLILGSFNETERFKFFPVEETPQVMRNINLIAMVISIHCIAIVKEGNA